MLVNYNLNLLFLKYKILLNLTNLIFLFLIWSSFKQKKYFILIS